MWEPTVESVMTRQVVTACRGTGVRELVALMSEHRVGSLPVIDEAGRPIGVVSEGDLRFRRARWRKPVGRTAGDLMTAPAVAVRTGTSVTAVVRALVARNTSRLCVVDDDGVLTGVVSRRDVVGMFLRGDDEIRADIQGRVLGHDLSFDGLTVAVACGVVTVEGSVARRSVARLAARLAEGVPGVVAVRDKVRYEVDDTVTSSF
jgi:CBS domain-containing protein